MTTYPMCGGCSVVLTPDRHVHYEGGVGYCSSACCKAVATRHAAERTRPEAGLLTPNPESELRP